MNQVMVGIFGILALIGSANVKHDLSSKGEKLIKSTFISRLVLFSIAYVYTRNWIAATVVVVLYLFVFRVLLYEAEDLEARLVDQEPFTLKYV